jgi:hypothetical protein
VQNNQLGELVQYFEGKRGAGVGERESKRGQPLVSLGKSYQQKLEHFLSWHPPFEPAEPSGRLQALSMLPIQPRTAINGDAAIEQTTEMGMNELEGNDS